MEFTFSPLLGIVGAAVLGGLLGLQRQAAQKPAGFRTHLIVAAASAAFTAMGAHLHDTRIPSYIVVGIGFLGAGAIIRDGGSTRGLTTAASLWMAAAIGLELGYANSFGLFVGVLITVITLLALSVSDSGLLKLFRIPQRATLHVVCDQEHLSLSDIAQAFKKAGVRFESESIVEYSAFGDTPVIEIAYNLELKRGRDLMPVIQQLTALPGVRRIEAKEPLVTG